ncbi:hypothetical protein [Dongia deserti]|uniref:hypothetical protein n=1 Tax=Dongia deserti TaxID=2268030 RepID=UPI000E654968|nr:hypothetical protein [Dongia deserti]
MAALGDLLFYRRDQVGLDDALRHEVELLRSKVDALPDKFFSERSDEEIAAHIAQEHAVQPLIVDFESATPSVQETQVEVRDRYSHDHSSVRVPGLLAKKSIPFKGDPGLWRLRTNPYNMNPPRGEIRGHTLIIGMTVPAQQADAAAAYIAQTIAEIPEYLQRQEAQIAKHNASLAMHAMQWIRLRRQRLGSASDLLKKLGG